MPIFRAVSYPKERPVWHPELPGQPRRNSNVVHVAINFSDLDGVERHDDLYPRCVFVTIYKYLPAVLVGSQSHVIVSITLVNTHLSDAPTRLFIYHPRRHLRTGLRTGWL